MIQLFSWRHVKQTITTSSNHVEFLALHETSCECVRLTLYVRETCGLSLGKMASPMIIYEDNVTCIAQIERGIQ